MGHVRRRVCPIYTAPIVMTPATDLSPSGAPLVTSDAGFVLYAAASIAVLTRRKPPDGRRKPMDRVVSLRMGVVSLESANLAFRTVTLQLQCTQLTLLDAHPMLRCASLGVTVVASLQPAGANSG